MGGDEKKGFGGGGKGLGKRERMDHIFLHDACYSYYGMGAAYHCSSASASTTRPRCYEYICSESILICYILMLSFLTFSTRPL